MNKSVLAAIALTASFGALAQEATVFPEMTAASTLTRADVKAQAATADRDVVFAGEATVFPAVSAPSAQSRAEVRAEARAALRSGLRFGGEATL
jgi:hypothetical protein